jgi:hypothetical protein
MDINKNDTAIVFIDPWNEVLSEKSLAWLGRRERHGKQRRREMAIDLEPSYAHAVANRYLVEPIRGAGSDIEEMIWGSVAFPPHAGASHAFTCSSVIFCRIAERRVSAGPTIGPLVARAELATLVD